jgi:hypothetical protein
MSDPYAPPPAGQPPLSPPPAGPQFDAQKTPAQPLPDDDELLEKFGRWDTDLQAHWSKWVEDAEFWFGFVSGEQWLREDVALMEEAEKIPVTFNMSGPVVDAVQGAEIQDRKQVQYYPRTPDVSDTGQADVLTQGANYLSDQCNGEQEDTEAFWDCLVCGVGWTETSVEVDGRDVAIPKARVDPLQLKADPASRKRCFEDARYLKREIPMTDDEFEDFRLEIGREDLDDGDLDGGLGVGKRATIVDPRQRYTHGQLGKGGAESPDVTVCEWQWWEKQAVHVAPMPHPTDPTITKLTPMTPAAFNSAKADNPNLRSVRSTQKVYYRAFATTAEVLFKEVLPEAAFRYQAITGKRDRNSGTYYGLVKPMVDPNRFVNKLYSEVLHIIRTNANGGMALEEDAVSDIRDFERSWAATDRITWLKPGSLSGAHGSKMVPKTPPAIQPALFQMMEWARDMVKACTGVNEEMLGLVGRDQAGVLEQQRKQAAYGVLSAFFDSKRRYQRNQGRLQLAMMRQYLPDDTLVRIVMDGEQQYVPIALALEGKEYDIVIDDAPAGPNTKAKVAAILIPMLPQMLQAGLIGPEQIADTLPFLDIPAAVAQKLGDAIRQKAQSAGPSPADQAELANKQADTVEKGAKTQKALADATLSRAKAFKDATDAHVSKIGLGVDILKGAGSAQPGGQPPTGGAIGQPKFEPPAVLGPGELAPPGGVLGGIGPPPPPGQGPPQE